MLLSGDRQNVISWLVENMDLYTEQGYKFHRGDGSRHDRHELSIKLPGVICHLNNNEFQIRYRTHKGGYNTQYWRLPWSSEREITTEEKALQLLDHMKEKSETTPLCPKRITSKSQLPCPYQFVTNIGYENGVAVSCQVLRDCKVIDIVAISNNLKLIRPSEPGTNPWFLFECQTHTSGRLWVIVNTNGYYEVSRSQKVQGKLRHSELTKSDKELISLAIRKFADG